ncbi:MAG: DUF3653 domain-containing protein [Acetobacteraceae bacterium]
MLRNPLLDFATAADLARWCGVSRKTAQLWRSGRRKPSRQALRLITLYRQERVLEGVWDGFTVRGPDLVDPHGNTVSARHILAYVAIIQLAAEFARQAGPAAQERFYATLGIAS